jgi:hypothetical protein
MTATSGGGSITGHMEASPVGARKVRKWTNREVVLAKVMRYVQDGWPSKVDE